MFEVSESGDREGKRLTERARVGGLELRRQEFEVWDSGDREGRV